VGLGNFCGLGVGIRPGLGVDVVLGVGRGSVLSFVGGNASGQHWGEFASARLGATQIIRAAL